MPEIAVDLGPSWLTGREGIMEKHTTASAPASLVPFLDTNEDELLTVAEVAALLKCKISSVYNLTRRRGRARYENPVPVLRLPMGLRFRRSSILAWLAAQEQNGGVQ